MDNIEKKDRVVRGMVHTVDLLFRYVDNLPWRNGYSTLVSYGRHDTVDRWLCRELATVAK